MSNFRFALEELQKEISRRSFLRMAATGAAAAVALDRFGDQVFAADDPALPAKVFSRIGDLMIPVDEDPGWKTFEPGITDFGMHVFVRQILLAGNEHAFAGWEGTVRAVNEVPPAIGYGPKFLDMVEAQQLKYMSAMLIGQFEIDGVQDLLGFGFGISLIAIKGTFFSNYPRHLATPGAEFQVPAPSAVKTGWDIMGYKGPVGPAEEQQLRAKALNHEEVPGVDWVNNPYI